MLASKALSPQDLLTSHVEHFMQLTHDEIKALVDEAYKLHYSTHRDEGITSIAIRLAYAAGADAELKACCDWVGRRENLSQVIALRTARRPKPQSLKEKALKQLQAMEQSGALDCNIDAIRLALESIPDTQG